MTLARPHLTPFTRLLIWAVSFLPIAALVPALGGWVPLPVTTVCITLPAWIFLFCYAARDAHLLKSLVVVVFIGMWSTLIYDGVRLTLTELGGLRDGIPNIGRLLIGDLNAPWKEVFAVSYFYRYLGDGGGLALAYFVGQRFSARTGMAFGASVCFCLWGTLVAFPIARVMLFPLTPYALMMTMTGHLVFGSLLGYTLSKVFPESRPTDKAPASEAGAGNFNDSSLSAFVR